MAFGDLVGKNINELTIISEFRFKNRIYCRVKCSCGKMFETRKDSINSNKTKSCGHLTQFKANDLTGKKFGMLRVIEHTTIKDGAYYWKCECDCGNIVEIKSANLTSGNTRSCGCYQKTLTSKLEENTSELKAQKYYKEGTNLAGLYRETPSNNTSGKVGVSWDKKRKMWVAQIGFQGKNIYLGRFYEKTDAIKAREEAEERYFKTILEKYKK